MEVKSTAANQNILKIKPKNLKFLLDFMDKMGLSMKDVGEIMGMSRQGVYYWFMKDDVKISNLYDLFDKLGYNLEFSYVRKVDNDELYFSESVIYNRPEDRARLGFLNTAMKEFGFSKGDISKKLQVGINTVYFWFKKDECFYAHLCDLAKVMNLKLKVQITPITPIAPVKD